MEPLVVLGSDTGAGMSLPADTSHKLGHKTKVNNKRTSQQRIFTDIRHAFEKLVIA